MSVRELVFEYTTKGARAAARADQKVRDSVRQTGRAAERNSGSVERWMERNRKAVQMVAAATLAATGAILSASPTLRAELGGIRAAFTLFSDTVVSDVLPASGSLAGTAVDAAQAYRDLDSGLRPVISTLGVIAGVMAGLAVVASGPVALLAGAFLGLTAGAYKFLDAILDLDAAMSGVRKILGSVGRLLRGDFSGAVTLAREGLGDLWRAGRETRQRVLLAIGQLVSGTVSRLRAWRARLLGIATGARDALVTKIMNARDRVIGLLDLAREFATAGKEWVGGLVRGVRDRITDMVDAFRDMASQAAQAFKDKFNELIPSRISIPSVSISIPSILGGGSRTVGGGSLRLPQLDTGGRIASDGLAMLHAGERIMPAAQVRERGPQPTGDSGTTIEEVNITVQAMGDDPAGTGRGIAREFERELSDRGA